MKGKRESRKKKERKEEEGSVQGLEWEKREVESGKGYREMERK